VKGRTWWPGSPPLLKARRWQRETEENSSRPATSQARAEHRPFLCLFFLARNSAQLVQFGLPSSNCAGQAALSFDSTNVQFLPLPRFLHFLRFCVFYASRQVSTVLLGAKTRKDTRIAKKRRKPHRDRATPRIEQYTDSLLVTCLPL
jgi:hypothetical protein